MILQNNKIFKKIKTYIIGICMGIADLIPGISGGTIAFIGGIYKTLLKSIANIDKKFLQYLLYMKRRKARLRVNGSFLVCLFLGITTSVIFVTRAIYAMLEMSPMLVFSFFTGIIISSRTYIYRKNYINMNLFHIFLIISSAIATYIITSTIQIHIPNTLSGFFLSGMLASIAMILPGISGSYMLLITGKYQDIITLIYQHTERIQSLFFHTKTTSLAYNETIYLLLFLGGIIVGLLTFSKILHWLFRNYNTAIIAFLLGCMAGTLPSILPRKSLSDAINPQGIRSIFLMLAGGILILILENLIHANTNAIKNKNKENFS